MTPKDKMLYKKNKNSKMVKIDNSELTEFFRGTEHWR